MSSPTPHSATLRAQVRELFRVHRVVTSAQLERRGLLRAADSLDLPRVTLEVRTQATQPTSQRELTFVAAEERWLEDQSSRNLLHHALLAETAERLAPLVPAAPTWKYLDLGDRLSGVRPDAELWWSDQPRDQDYAVEADAGYGRERREQKLTGAATLGYRHLVWSTSIQGRVATIVQEAATLAEQGQLPGLAGVSAVYVNVHSTGRPYDLSRRNHKSLVAQWRADGRVISDGSG
ncbi:MULTISPECIES: hypothetical protein [unclassified Deinococcus]|uniref:hypothetical protein n=1 Tax=unclassified Deinococcus TaxID=2623546 RepID=UPI001E53F995|nr:MULTISPECIES: hypothetical protein [unclassified Deinococcus]MCD0155877.1 hypothetical protein [Deinococcus sp. 6GRE01]MCD0160282.1 hypothetical protein [Deinococcus sp. 6YEL10]